MALLRSHGTLVANVVTTVTLASPEATPMAYIDWNGNAAERDFQRLWIHEVEVVNVDNVDEIYFTLDGSTPTVGGQGTFSLPMGGSVRHEPVGRDELVEVKLISAGAAQYSVSVAA